MMNSVMTFNPSSLLVMELGRKKIVRAKDWLEKENRACYTLSIRRELVSP